MWYWFLCPCLWSLSKIGFGKVILILWLRVVVYRFLTVGECTQVQCLGVVEPNSYVIIDGGGEREGGLPLKPYVIGVLTMRMAHGFCYKRSGCGD